MLIRENPRRARRSAAKEGHPRSAQFLAGFSPGDAISMEAINIQRVIGGEIYVWPTGIHPKMRRGCRPVTEFNPRCTDILIFHFSIGTPLTHIALDFPGKKVMIYHNITPAHYFDPYNPEIAQQLRWGREQLSQIVNAFDLHLADSEFNRKELEALGYKNTHVFPILFDPSQLPKPPQRPPSFLREKLTTIFFVGRLAPNKKAEDLIKIFGLYQKFYNPKSRLLWVGAWGGLELYRLELQTMIKDLGIRNVIFSGHVSPHTLAACYGHGDIFASTSEHEGFCVPALESFYYGKPVLAYSAGALPETINAAGILMHQKDYSFVEALNHLHRDAIAKQLGDRGKARLVTHFDFERLATLLKSYLASLG